MESTKRTIIKSIMYRTVVAISIFLAALIMDYSAGFGLKFVILVYTVGLASFYVQERIWNRFSWGINGIYENNLRTLAKTITWRLWSMIVLFVFGIILGLSNSDAVEWTIVTNILFFVVHYLHERIWNLISWQKTEKEETNIEV